MNIANKKIILGLTGGIACYKIAELIRLLTQGGAMVHVVMTENATRFITPMTMQALSGNPVYTQLWDENDKQHMPHIHLTRDADAILIAPCSAHFLAKLAHGLCDDLLSNICIARPKILPLFIAPAMNVEMWENPATQRNVATLLHDGITILGPNQGIQACGEEGLGRMLEPNELLDHLETVFHEKILKGKRVLITAGPTYEPIDPIRGITNLSSGKMGFAIAKAAQQAGAIVELISGSTHLPTPYGVTRTNVQTAQQMHDQVMLHIGNQDIFISVAAVADWRVIHSHEHKIKKTTHTEPQLQLTKNPDILATVAALPRRPYCVGFAAESENLLQHGEEKRVRKNLPLLVGNIGPHTFGAEENELILFDEYGHTTLPRANKRFLAEQLIKEIVKRFNPAPTYTPNF